MQTVVYERVCNVECVFQLVSLQVGVGARLHLPGSVREEERAAVAAGGGALPARPVFPRQRQRPVRSCCGGGRPRPRVRRRVPHPGDACHRPRPPAQLPARGGVRRDAGVAGGGVPVRGRGGGGGGVRVGGGARGGGGVPRGVPVAVGRRRGAEGVRVPAAGAVREGGASERGRDGGAAGYHRPAVRPAATGGAAVVRGGDEDGGRAPRPAAILNLLPEPAGAVPGRVRSGRDGRRPRPADAQPQRARHPRRSRRRAGRGGIPHAVPYGVPPGAPQ